MSRAACGSPLIRLMAWRPPVAGGGVAAAAEPRARAGVAVRGGRDLHSCSAARARAPRSDPSWLDLPRRRADLAAEDDAPVELGLRPALRDGEVAHARVGRPRLELLAVVAGELDVRRELAAGVAADQEGRGDVEALRSQLARSLDTVATADPLFVALAAAVGEDQVDE